MTAISQASLAGSPPRLAALRRFSREFAARPAAMTGLAILVALTVLALAAPLFIHATDLDVINAPGQPLAPPSARFPLGTDYAGRSILTLLIWGTRPSLAIGVLATVLTMIVGSSIGLLAGHYGGVLVAGPDGGDRLVHRPADPAAGDRPGRGARPGRHVDHDRDRGHLLAGHGPADPGPDAGGGGPAVHRAGQGPGRARRPARGSARCCRTWRRSSWSPARSRCPARSSPRSRWSSSGWATRPKCPGEP